jgi:excinuclease UvrABC nuclease subunit
MRLPLVCQPDAIDAVPNRPGVFLVWPSEGSPYLARTGLLRRRLLRLLGVRDKPSRLLNLRNVAGRVEYWLTGSQLESSLLFYELAKRHFPDAYLKLCKLRMPAYVKLTLSNPFPRTLVTARLGGGAGLYYGPFRTRAAAEDFEKQFLDLFQIRRCEENLEPRVDHPGCIYGEMSMCLRPCQMAVGADEYRHEAARVEQFLATDGTALLETIAASRDRLSEELNFEEAARQHKRMERVEKILSLRDDLAHDIDRLWAVAVTPSVEVEAVELWFFAGGLFLPARQFPLASPGDQIVSMDQRLRETAAGLEAPRASQKDRQEALALLARWYYSSWRDGELLLFESPAKIPYRKLVNAISRVVKGAVRPLMRLETKG